jgi:hypothetical protein
MFWRVEDTLRQANSINCTLIKAFVLSFVLLWSQQLQTSQVLCLLNLDPHFNATKSLYQQNQEKCVRAMHMHFHTFPYLYKKELQTSAAFAAASLAACRSSALRLLGLGIGMGIVARSLTWDC